MNRRVDIPMSRSGAQKEALQVQISRPGCLLGRTVTLLDQSASQEYATRHDAVLAPEAPDLKGTSS